MRISRHIAACAFVVFGMVAFAVADEPADPKEKLDATLKRAEEELGAKQWDKAIATLADALKQSETAGLNAEEKDRVLELVHYNSCCALSLKGEKDKALDALEKALEAHYYDFDHMAEDHDLDAIRDAPRFKALMEKHKAKAKSWEAEKVLGAITKDAAFPFDFDLEGIDGKPLKLADYKGKVVLVDVWGTWCPPCRKEVPHLVELHQKLGPKGFSVVGLNYERGDKPETTPVVQAFVAENKIPYRCGLIDDAFTGKIPGFEGFPTLLLVDRAGRVRLKQVGYTEAAVLEAAAEKLLSEPK